MLYFIVFLSALAVYFKLHQVIFYRKTKQNKKQLNFIVLSNLAKV